MNKIIALALLSVTVSAHAAPDLHPAEATLLKQLETLRKQDLRCDNTYTDKLLKIDTTAPGGGEEYQNAKDAQALLKLLKSGRPAEGKAAGEVVSTILTKSAEIRGEKVMGEWFTSTSCKTFAEYNVLRRLILNTKLAKKGFPTAKDLKPRLLNYLQRGSELDSLMTLIQIALVRSASESGVVKISDDLLKEFAALSNAVGAAKKKNDLLAREVWDKASAKNAEKPEEKELLPDQLNKLMGFEIQRVRDMQPIRKEYVALVSKLKAQNP